MAKHAELAPHELSDLGEMHTDGWMSVDDASDVETLELKPADPAVAWTSAPPSATPDESRPGGCQCSAAARTWLVCFVAITCYRRAPSLCQLAR